MGESVFWGIGPAFCAKIRLGRRCTRETICIKAVIYVVGIVPDFIEFIGKKFWRRVGWVKGKALIFLSTALRNHKTTRSRALRIIYSLLT